MRAIASAALDGLIPATDAGRRWGFALEDGRILMLVADEIGSEEGITLALHDRSGARVTALSRRLWLGGGFVTEPVPAGPDALCFEFPAGVAWRVRVVRVPAWLQRFGLGPLRLERARSG
jgi:hypothetical protein